MRIMPVNLFILNQSPQPRYRHIIGLLGNKLTPPYIGIGRAHNLMYYILPIDQRAIEGAVIPRSIALKNAYPDNYSHTSNSGKSVTSPE